MIGKLLGHRRVTTTARHAHLARDTEKASHLARNSVRESAARVSESVASDIFADDRPSATAGA